MLAYAVMPNHLHLIVVQGQQPLSELMQPMLRRIALLLQRRTSMEGHVFERRFHATPCLDSEYLRNAVAYVHLNGVRAKLCSTPDEDMWCSHSAFCALPDRTHVDGHGRDAPLESGLRLFAAREHDSLQQCRANYRAFLEWRRNMDEYLRSIAEGLCTQAPPPCPSTAGGDLHWQTHFTGAGMRPKPLKDQLRPDLLDIARATLAELDPEMSLEVLRSGFRTRPVVALRRRFILRAIAAGHRCGVIARFLHIAPSTVSSVRTASTHKGRFVHANACAKRP